jgi:hypothetical protein
MTKGLARFIDGTETKFTLAYEAFMAMFRSATLDGKRIEWIETYSSSNVPHRTLFS